MTGGADLEYSPSSLVADLPGYLEAYAERSARARRDHRYRTLSYGEGRHERADFFPAHHGASLHVFVHGGYWQELGKDDSSFAAPAFLSAGIAYAALGYGLAPRYQLDDIVDMVRRGLRRLAGSAEAMGVDPARIVVSGTSAGAQLVLMALCTDAVLRRVLSGVALLSGIYDLRELVHTYVNDALGLTAGAARRNSPLLRLPSSLPPVVLARGGAETAPFVRQHEQLAAQLRDRTQLTEIVAPARNHFDLPDDLADPATELGRAVLAAHEERA
ncbi:alpha/beta hydrolase [Amycolatopsis pithecellobii]|uniref:Alpha/beta hydrolase fold domain-containing protein n=1 Tax=Amycolatopsis pithecellobii TaxID=664692 RepID=A0A6N7YKC3_9PSEU|nr:alpha/beta hydrolase [Amycolatopsis pithecellobii]MTD53337.1 alpha/beta hydrolase fold domain-containing protein [Amycolatopsis pithecellobii]